MADTRASPPSDREIDILTTLKRRAEQFSNLERKGAKVRRCQRRWESLLAREAEACTAEKGGLFSIGFERRLAVLRQENVVLRVARAAREMEALGEVEASSGERARIRGAAKLVDITIRLRAGTFRRRVEAASSSLE